MKSLKISLLTKTLSMLLLMSLIFIGCSKDPDDNPDPGPLLEDGIYVFGKEQLSLRSSPKD